VTVIQPGAGVQERVRREKARRHFMDFCGYVDKKYPVDAPHLQLLADKLEGVAEYVLSGGVSGIPRLMVFMPPRYWKSNTCSQKFPAWLLGKDPEKRVILASYGADLASEHSARVRDLIEGERYKNIFGERSSLEAPVEIDESKRAAQAWNLASHNGGMISAGVGGAIVGKGGHLLVLDDPFKNREEAESEANRSRIKKWYRSSFYTRQEDGAAIIIILTRWDQDDIAGALLSESVGNEDADKWDVIFLPSETSAEVHYPITEIEYRENLLRGLYLPMGGDILGRGLGEPLWPAKHSSEQLHSIRANIGDFEYSSQYLQMPRLAVGEFFDDQDFRVVERAPDGLQWYWYCDLALGNSETSDFNATMGVGMDEQGNLYLRDLLKERELETFMGEVRRLMHGGERGAFWGVEDVAFQALVFQQFLRDQTLVSVDIRAIRPVGDKVTRARPWRRRAKDGHLFLVRGAWNQAFIREAAAFPKGRHDDAVDAVSGAVQMMEEFAGSGWLIS
jgi:predicted phage terminase large subunit-like protein